ncbi:MAG: beta-L-arabinofuranosidase domain-containing protein [Isosphaeraceae bacterium]
MQPGFRSTVIIALALVSGAWSLEVRSAEQRSSSRAPIPPIAFRPLPLGQVKPAGWLLDQLRVQASGISGHLDEFWPDIKNSAWIGGKAEGWERLPYWLDGFVPLAYLLDDPALEARAKRVIDYVLDHQQADGWLGPVGDTAGHKPYDPWPLFPLFKALMQYQEATADPRVVPALEKCARKIGQVMDQTPLYSWAKMRAADFAVAMIWLRVKTGDSWPLDLARKAFGQSHDWRAQFDDFKFTARTQTKFALDTHGVNTGMALKYGGIRYLLTSSERDRTSAIPMLDLLDRYHGQATGIFTCDEHLAGRSPSQGTELCTVVEALYSLELLAAITGDARLADRLEKIAYNALPATFKKDMTAHQYDQQCNQVICTRAQERVYVNNGPDSNLYGLEPNFGCCTANMHQGWPKFTSSLWMKSSDGGLAAIAYAPCVVETTIKGKPVKLEVKTDYPFRETVQISVTVKEPMSFPIHLRAPGWTKEVVVQAPDVVLSHAGTRVRADSMVFELKEGARFLAFSGEWNGAKTMTLRLPMPVQLYHGFNNSVAIQRGPLVYALKIGAEWKKVKDNPRFADWEVHPTTPWNYALSLDRDQPRRSLRFEERPMQCPPFSPDGAPMIAHVQGRRYSGWKLEKGAAAPPPQSPVSSDAPPEELTLIPYGCTDLRITEFPTLSNR